MSDQVAASTSLSTSARPSMAPSHSSSTPLLLHRSVIASSSAS
eukprot:CAMPEP_0119464790 /NCGR_PEP_ID=MMETSP1344-20130328/227_1 /TAXON_ID=236787 /ORGANISM="Florenciella parvula, Strain CCMP2471" /LENGTH=42 /DNA_ID= /DNA_START= /DNA_END= /DNA_ORIENTATION=